MKILFVTVAPLERGPMGLTSFLASTRYRAIIPAEQLSRRGHEVEVRSSGEGEWAPDIVEFPCDVLVVSKSLARENERHIARMQARGVKVVVDMCDNVFDDAKYGAHFRALAGLADVVVSSGEAMAEAVRRLAGRDSVVVTDPVEGPRGRARFAPRLPGIRVLWFGNALNIEGVRERSDELAELCEVIPVRLTLVTSPWKQVREFAEALGAAHPGRLEVSLVPWSPEATWRALAECDVSWIPVAAAGIYRTKSPNRLVESLWAGRLVAADEIPSYVPFASTIPVGKRLGEAVFASLGDTQAVEARIADAQRRIASGHSPYACGVRWASALGDESQRPLRLNVGCGGRILEGFVNVDAHARLGVRHDLTCDLGDLAPFASGSAAEVVCVDAVTRFAPADVGGVLREWVRVLQPGGALAIECPNLAAAGHALSAGKADDETLRLLYGDPAQDEASAARRWGYTPATLAALLRAAGLVDVREEAPRYLAANAGLGMRLAASKA